jgi:hypothetical protein
VHLSHEAGQSVAVAQHLAGRREEGKAGNQTPIALGHEARKVLEATRQGKPFEYLVGNLVREALPAAGGDQPREPLAEVLQPVHGENRSVGRRR